MYVMCDVQCSGTVRDHYETHTHTRTYDTYTHIHITHGSPFQLDVFFKIFLSGGASHVEQLFIALECSFII